MKRWAVTLACIGIFTFGSWAIGDAVRIQLPTYGAGANPAAAPAPEKGDSPLLLAIATALTRIEARIANIEARLNGGAAPVPPPPADTTKPPATPPPADTNEARFKRGAQVIGKACVSCHIVSKAEKAGGSFVIVEDDGKLAQLGAEAIERIKRRTKNKSMPPREHPALTDAEINDLIFLIEASGAQPESQKKE